MTLTSLLSASLSARITMKSGFVVTAPVIHRGLNGTAGPAILVVVGGNAPVIGVAGPAGFSALAFTAVSIFVFDPTPLAPKVVAS